MREITLFTKQENQKTDTRQENQKLINKQIKSLFKLQHSLKILNKNDQQLIEYTS